MKAREIFEENLVLSRDSGYEGGEAWSLNILGLVACYQGDYGRASALLSQSEAIFRKLEDEASLVLPLAFQGLVAYYQCDLARAEALWQESLSLAREFEDSWNLGVASNGLGLIAVSRGDFSRAMDFLQEALAASQLVGEKRITAMALNSLGRLARAQGDLRQASALHRQSLALRRELGAKRGMAETLTDLAIVATQSGGPENYARAARMLGAAEALRARIGAPLPPVERRDFEECVAALEAGLGETEFAALRAEGRANGMDQAVSFLDPRE